MIDTSVDKPALVDQIIAAIGHALPSASERTSSTCLFTESPLAAIHRIKGVKEETVCAWLQWAAEHVEEIEAVLLANYPVSCTQLDAPLDLCRTPGRKRG
jgi:hypothetical protein